MGESLENFDRHQPKSLSGIETHLLTLLTLDKHRHQPKSLSGIETIVTIALLLMLHPIAINPNPYQGLKQYKLIESLAFQALLE